jgi:energy-converting hydrogenase Eha subunit A
MTNSFDGILPERNPGGDAFYYALALLFGAGAAWADIKVGDLLLTAMIVLAACMLLGFIRPRKPWRWVLLIGFCVPVVEWCAHFLMSQKLPRAQIYESFLAFLPGIAGAIGGALFRGVIDNLFPAKP